MGSVNALDPAFWLAMQPGITGDEQYEILHFMVDSCPAGAFATTFHRLSLAEQEPPRFQALLARFLTRRGSLKPAGEILAAAREKDTDINLLRERARLACRIGTPDKLSEAWECFRKLDGLDKVEALSVLRMIVMAPGRLLPSGLGVPSQLDEWLSAIPGTTTDDRLMAFDGKLAAGEPLGTVSAEVMDKFAATHPVETVRWLSRHGRHDEVLQLAATPGLEPSATYAALIEAQIARGFYSIATGTLSNPPPKFDPTDLAFLRIRLAEASRDPDPKPWEDAIKQVSRLGDGTRALELAELAASLHRGPQKQDAIAAACRQPGGPLPLFRDILPILGSLGKQDRIFELIAILANLRRFEAGDPLLMKAFLYIKCLNGDLAPSEVLPSLRDLCGRESSDDNTIALAFTLLLSGECREPVLLLEPIERHTGNNKLLEALLGTALRLCGRAEEGKRFLSRVQWDSGQMLPIEERCIKRLLAPVEAREAAEEEAAARAAVAAGAGATVTEGSKPGDDAAAPAGAKQSP